MVERLREDVSDCVPAPVASCAEAGSFERDSVTWSFAKLAERVIRAQLRPPAARARYVRWITREAPALAGTERAEQGLVLSELDLDGDGALTLIARPTRGQFVLVVRHERFEVVMATTYGVVMPRRQQDGVCLAHFEGDAALSVRWALALHESLGRGRAAASRCRPAPN